MTSLNPLQPFVWSQSVPSRHNIIRHWARSNLGVTVREGLGAFVSDEDRRSYGVHGLLCDGGHPANRYELMDGLGTQDLREA